MGWCIWSRLPNLANYWHCHRRALEHFRVGRSRLGWLAKGGVNNRRGGGAADTFPKLLFHPFRMHGGLEARNGNGLVHPCCRWLTFDAALCCRFLQLEINLADPSIRQDCLEK